MECQWQPDGHATHDPSHIKHLHACHHDGQCRDDQHHPGILFFYTHANLRVRKRDRDDCYKDDLDFRFMDAAHIPGIADPQQHQRHLYTDLLYLQREHAGWHQYNDCHAVCPSEHQAHDHGHHGNPGRRDCAIKLGHLRADEEQSDADDHRRCRCRRLYY